MIADAPGEIAAGGKPFTVRFKGPAPRADGVVVLMALGAFTHGFDQNQRAVPLTATVSGPGEVTVMPPRDAWVAPEGDSRKRRLPWTKSTTSAHSASRAFCSHVLATDAVTAFLALGVGVFADA